MPDVDVAVAVEIDAVLVKFRRQELRQTDGAAPGRTQILARHLAVAEHLQRQDELVAILILAAADIGLRRQHAHRVVRQRVAAVIGLAAPDREHDGRRHAEALFDPLKARAVFLHQPLPFFGELRDAGFLDVVGRHLHELGLRRRAGRGPSGQDQIGQFVIRLEAAGFVVERRARHAGGLRVRPQRGDELGEGGVGGVGGRQSCTIAITTASASRSEFRALNLARCITACRS